MARTFLMPAALALGAILTVNANAPADDTVRLGGAMKGGFGTATLNLAGQGTAANAAAANDDTEQMWYRRGWGGWGWGGGWGWHGHRHWGGYRAYYGGWWPAYSYRSFAVGFPAYSYVGFPYYGVSYYSFPAYYGGFCGISGSTVDVNAPAINLAAAAPAEADRAFPPAAGAYRVITPQTNPAPAVQPQPAPPRPAPRTLDLPVSYKVPASKPAAPYTFKAYGDE